MATVRTANAHWEGSLLEGSGTVELASSGLATFDVSWPARSEAANGKTSPEELIAAAHSTCYSMALSHGLAGAGTPPTTVDTSAKSNDKDTKSFLRFTEREVKGVSFLTREMVLPPLNFNSERVI